MPMVYIKTVKDIIKIIQQLASCTEHWALSPWVADGEKNVNQISIITNNYLRLIQQCKFCYL